MGIGGGGKNRAREIKWKNTAQIQGRPPVTQIRVVTMEIGRSSLANLLSRKQHYELCWESTKVLLCKIPRHL